jgi:hypothetical protein
MYATATDVQGSGSVHYLRTDLRDSREIRIVVCDWSPYVHLSNTVTLPTNLTITVPSELLESNFEARRNLQALRSDIRSMSMLISADAHRAAENALQRLEQRKAETVEDWAERLSQEISNQND